MGAEFFHAGRQTEGPKDRRRDEKTEAKQTHMTQPITALSNFANVPKKRSTITPIFSNLS
jgi:hypothetical protein